MGEIIVTSSTLRSKAEELNQLNEQFKSAVNSLTEEEGALRSQYEGDASDAFHTQFSNDTIQMNNFYNAIAQYVQKLIQIAEAYEKAEQANVATANARNYQNLQMSDKLTGKRGIHYGRKYFKSNTGKIAGNSIQL